MSASARRTTAGQVETYCRAPYRGRSTPAELSPEAARRDGRLGEFVLDRDDVVATVDPRATALEFVRSAFQHACRVCGCEPALAAGADGIPPPVG